MSSNQAVIVSGACAIVAVACFVSALRTKAVIDENRDRMLAGLREWGHDAT